jgi:hypothetical protein
MRSACEWRLAPRGVDCFADPDTGFASFAVWRGGGHSGCGGAYALSGGAAVWSGGDGFGDLCDDDGDGARGGGLGDGVPGMESDADRSSEVASGGLEAIFCAVCGENGSF